MSDITELYPKDNDDEALAALKQKLASLHSEHRDLDQIISRLSDESTADRLQLQRLKKRKLSLKDEIARLHAQLLPDIIA